VQFHCTLAFAKYGPGEQRQTQIDGRCIERINSFLEFDAEAVVDIEFARGADQHLCEICVDVPIAHLICIRQSVPRNAAANAHVIELRSSRTQTSFDIAQAFAIRQLRECHTQELIPTRELLQLVGSLVTIYATMKLVRRKKVHQLRENRFARIHEPPPPAKLRKVGSQAEQNSNRL